MKIFTSHVSTATDEITLNLINRNLTIQWISGSTETVKIRRRDQLKFLACHLGILMPLGELSYGQFANWCHYNSI